jgi:hypothetical protein
MSQATVGKYSLHSNEVSLSTMRLGRGREWAVKKAKIEAKDETYYSACRFSGSLVGICPFLKKTFENDKKNMLTRFH